MAVLKLLRQSPWSARVGMAMILVNVIAAALTFTPWLPYTQTEIVGDVWLPASSENRPPSRNPVMARATMTSSKVNPLLYADFSLVIIQSYRSSRNSVSARPVKGLITILANRSW